MVVGKLWKGKDGVARTWTIILRWHTQCWIDQAIQKLEKQPFIETKGRKRLDPGHTVAEVKDGNRGARHKIMMRRAAVVQRIKKEVELPEQSIDKIIHLGEMLNQLREEIELVGGVPKSWE